MTPLPKKKLSRARQGKRRASISLKLKTLTNCQKCGKPKLPFIVCPNCGFYNGVQILQPKVKVRKHEEPTGSQA